MCVTNCVNKGTHIHTYTHLWTLSLQMAKFWDQLLKQSNYLPCQSPVINWRATFRHREKLSVLPHREVISLVLLSKWIFIVSLSNLNAGQANGHTVLCEVRLSLIRVIQRTSVLLDSSCCINDVSYDVLTLISTARVQNIFPKR
jgi:hypothetical protein